MINCQKVKMRAKPASFMSRREEFGGGGLGRRKEAVGEAD